MKNDDVNMLTCTPVLAGRKLGPMVPESPFLSSAAAARDNTPMLKGVMLKESAG